MTYYGLFLRADGTATICRGTGLPKDEVPGGARKVPALLSSKELEVSSLNRVAQVVLAEPQIAADAKLQSFGCR